MTISPKIILITAGMTSSLFFSGVIFGWAPLQLILEGENVAAEECDLDKEECDSQIEKLAFIYTLGSTVAVFGAFPVGHFVDTYGPVASAAVGGVLEVVGLLLLALAGKEQYFAYCLAAMCLAAGGAFTLLNSYPLCYMVEPEHLSAIATASNCLFDASGAVFLLCFIAYSQLHLSRQAIFLFLAFLAAVTYFVLTYMWMLHREEFYRKKLASLHGPSTDTVTSPAYVTTFHSKSWQKQLSSAAFVYFAIIGTVHLLRSNIYMGTVKLVLESLHDDEQGYLYTQIFAATLPVGFVFIPVINHVIMKYGFVGTFQLINALGFLFGFLTLIPVLPLQVVTFLAFCVFRAFFYSALSTYAAQVFGPRNVGRIYGAVMAIAAVFNLLQYPALIVTAKYAHGNLLYLNVALLVLCFPLIALTHIVLEKFLHKYPMFDVANADKGQVLGDVEMEDVVSDDCDKELGTTYNVIVNIRDSEEVVNGEDASTLKKQ